MATVAHRIVSHYTAPKEKESIVGAVPADGDEEWQTIAGPKRRFRPVNFVPAAAEYDDNGMPIMPNEEPPQPAPAKEKAISSWYQSLTRSSGSGSSMPKTEDDKPPIATSSSSIAHPQLQRKPNKNDWFITRALKSLEAPIRSSSSTQTLPEILARDAPPLPSEPRFVPQTWIALGPTNRGFGMLMRSGWQEGEGLGVKHVQVKAEAVDASGERLRSDKGKGKMRQSSPISDLVKEKDINLKKEEPEVIDLTISDDSESEHEPDLLDFHPSSRYIPRHTTTTSGATPLLTPLPTILKSDRFGLGHPSARKKRAITHTSQAIKKHIRASDAMKQHLIRTERLRKHQAEVGRGARGYARSQKMEARERQGMLTYMNMD